MSCSHCASKFLQPFVAGAGAGAMRSLRQQRQDVSLAPLLHLARRSYTSPTRPDRNNHLLSVNVDPQGDDFFVPYEGVLVKPRTREVCQKSITWEARWTKAPINPMFDNSWNVESEETTRLPRAFVGQPFGSANKGEPVWQEYELDASDEFLLNGETPPRNGGKAYEAFHHKVLRGAEKSAPYKMSRNRLNTWELPDTKAEDGSPDVPGTKLTENRSGSESSSETSLGDKEMKFTIKRSPPKPEGADAKLTWKGKDDTPEEVPRNPPPVWLVQKLALKKKFGDEEWRPRKMLSPDVHEIIRGLNKTYAECTTEKLAEAFKVSAESIRRILKSKWQPTAEEHENRMERWARRKNRIHQKALDEGVFQKKEANRQRQISKLENAYSKGKGVNLNQRIL